MTHHRVYYNRGAQTIYTIPFDRGRHKRVTAATYGIVDLLYADSSTDHDLVSAGTAATVDSVSTTTTAKAGNAAADRRVLTVASTTSIAAGHCYLLENSAGYNEIVKITEVKSATALLTAAEIVGDYASSSTLKGIEVQATFPLSAANDEDNLQRGRNGWLINWLFTGIDTPYREAIFLERAEELQLATLADLQQLDPMIARIGGDRIDPALALAQAHRDFRTDLMLAGAFEADMLTGPIGRDAVTYLAAWHSMKHLTGESDRARSEHYRRRYDELRAALQVGKQKPETIAVDQHDETPKANPASLFLAF